MFLVRQTSVCLRLIGAAVVFCVILTSILLPQPVMAGDDSVSIIQSRLAIGRKLRNHAWCPVITRVRNHTNQDKKLGIVITWDVNGLNQWNVSYRKEVRLPANSSRRVESFIRLDFPDDALAREFRERDGRKIIFKDGTERTLKSYRVPNFSMRTEAFDEKGQSWPDTFPVPVVHPNALFMAVADGHIAPLVTAESYDLFGLPQVLGEHAGDYLCVGGNAPPYSDVSSNRSSPTAAEIGKTLRSSMMGLADLPTKWAAYEGVNVLLLGSLRGRRGEEGIDPAQRRALLRWVRSGGRLVIIPAHDLASYRHPFWEQLLPVRLIATRRLQNEWKSAEAKYGKILAFDREQPPRLVEALPGHGEVLVRDGERVLLARRQVGGGQVWFSALTASALTEWSAGYRMWTDILRPPLDPIPGIRDNFPDYAPNFLARVIGVKVPSRSALVLILSIYLAGCAVGLFAFRRWGRAESGWLVVVILSPLCAGATYMVGKSGAEAKLVQGEIGVTVLGSGETLGSANSFVGLYSSAQAFTGDVKWENADALATATASATEASAGGQQRRVMTVSEGRDLIHPKLRIPKREMIGLRIMTLVEYGDGVSFRLNFDAQGVTGQVVNNTGRDLVDCLIRLNRRTLRIGDLKKGERFDLAKGTLAWDLQARKGVLSAESRLRSDALAEILRYPRRTGYRSRQNFDWPIAFYGWSSSSQAALTHNGKRPDEHTRQLLVVPARDIQPSGKTMVPAGVCGLRLLKRGSALLGGVFGFPPQPRRAGFGEVRFPMGKRGQQKRAAARKNTTDKNGNKKKARRGSLNSFNAEPIKPTHEPAGWRENKLPLSTLKVPLVFTLPRSLRSIQVKRITLVADMDFRNCTGTVGIRKPGDKEFRILSSIKLGGKTKTVIPKIAQYLGANGELPEFRLIIEKVQPKPPAGKKREPEKARSRFVKTPGHYAIRTFDIIIEGQFE